MKTKYAAPHPVSDAMVAFPSPLLALLPSYAELDPKYKSYDTLGAQVAERWFNSGLSRFPKAKAGIDEVAAARHLHCIMGSFEPKHEHKIHGAGFLFELWYEEEDLRVVLQAP